MALDEAGPRRRGLGQIPIELLDDGLGVASDDLRAVGFAAVEQKLRLGGLSRLNSAREIIRHNQDADGALFTDDAIDPILGETGTISEKGFCCGEALQEFEPHFPPSPMIDGELHVS